MKVLLTGASGFLGWHTRVRLRALTQHDVRVISRRNWGDLPCEAEDADAVIHVAGANRGTAQEVEECNVELARQVASAVRGAHSAPRIVYANSVMAGNGSAYGTGKATAARLLSLAAEEVGSSFVDVQLPNLFGEYARPNYNSFVATFVEAVINGTRPEVQEREIEILHVQDAAQSLIDALVRSECKSTPRGTNTTVREVYELLGALRSSYFHADVPSLDTKLAVDMMNTLRARLFPEHYPLALPKHIDARGRLTEIVRAHGGQGQTFVSTTQHGGTRGDHFHLTKFERFAVLNGKARISLRKLFTKEVVSFEVSGSRPAVVDMPTMWSHNITNTGDGDLITLFWAHELFDVNASDTYPELVDVTGHRP